MIALFANRWAVSLPPIWLLGAGALATLVAAAACWCVLALIRPRAAAELNASLDDGFLWPVTWVLFVAASIAVAFSLVNLVSPAPAVPIGPILQSLRRMTSADKAATQITVPPGGKPLAIPLDLRPQELAEFTLTSNVRLVARTQQPIAGFALDKSTDLDLAAGEPWTWRRSDGATNPFQGQRALLEAINMGSEPATLEVGWRLVPEFPQAAILPWTFIVLSGLVAAYAAFRLLAPRVAAVAAATTKEAIGQPMFAVAILAGAFLIPIFIIIPYNTFGEDVKMLKDSGLTLVKVLALLVVVWTASVAVADEIEGRTALTVLSKPLRRWQFVLGKFAGLVLVATLVFLVLGAVLLATTSLKVVYDAREGAKVDPLWTECADEMITVVPGLALSLMETILMAAVSLAVSTRLGMVPNLIVCFAVYTLGHLVPLIVQSSVGRFALVRFTGRLFATLLPVLDHFTIEAAVVGGVAVPWSYLGWAAAYAALYSAIALLVALVLFQDRDLA